MPPAPATRPLALHAHTPIRNEPLALKTIEPLVAYPHHQPSSQHHNTSASSNFVTVMRAASLLALVATACVALVQATAHLRPTNNLNHTGANVAPARKLSQAPPMPVAALGGVCSLKNPVLIRIKYLGKPSPPQLVGLMYVRATTCCSGCSYLVLR